MIPPLLTNEILSDIIQIEINQYKISKISFPDHLLSKLRSDAKKRAYASNKIEGNPLSKRQVEAIIESDDPTHLLQMEKDELNYYHAINALENKAKNKEKFPKALIVEVHQLINEGKSGLRGAMPKETLFAVYNEQSGNSDYIPPEYTDILKLLDELVEYVNTTDDHPLIAAAVVHYQLVTIPLLFR